MAIPFQTLINSALQAKQKQRGKKEINSWHASKIGYCLRGLSLERNGAEPDQPMEDRLLRVFQMGNHIEDWLVDLAQQSQEMQVETQVRIESPELDVTGYADMLIKYQGEKQVYELKSQHSKSFWYMQKQGGANLHHQYQLWLYLHVLGIDRGNIVYVSKDDLSVAEYPVLRDNAILREQVLGRIAILNECRKSGTLPPLPENPKSFEAKFCAYHKQCVEAENKKLI